MGYGEDYTVEMSGCVRRKLFMQIGFRVERLMIAQGGYEEEQRGLAGQEQEFYRISRIRFT